MTKSIKLLFFIYLFFIQAIYAQQSVIAGRVVDEASQQPLAGVSVKIRNSTVGTSTDAEGKYSLNVDNLNGQQSIVFSYTGYKSETKTIALKTGKNLLNCGLSSDLVGLDEVIITGTSAGTTRKQLGSYISSVKGDDLTKGRSGNVLSSLQGKTAGAQISQNSGDPAGGISVRLRGISSVNSSSEPLYIVDGIIVNNNTTRVTNTQTGYDGGNFVGTIGQNRLVDINPADIERIEVLNGAAAAAIYGSRANAGVVQIFTKRGSLGKPVVTFSSSYSNSNLRKKVPVNQSSVKFGGSVDTETQDVLNTALITTSPVNRYDYQDYIFRNASGTDNNLSVAGGKDDTKYYVSASYFNNQGIVKNTNFRRFSLRTNIDQKLADWISFSAGLNYINSGADEKPDGNSFYSPLNSINIIANYHDLFTRDVDGNLKSVGERGRINPVSVIEDIKQRQEVNRILGNLNLKLTPVEGLSIDYTLGVDHTGQNGKTYIPPYTYNVNPDYWGGGSNLNPTQNGYASVASNSAFLINQELNATYNATFSDVLTSTSQLGFSYQYEKSNYNMLNGRGLAPFIETVNAASTILPGMDIRSEYSVSGAYFQQNFKYKDHLFLTGAVRVDESSVFGEDNRRQVYIKGSGSYVLSSADYWKNTSLSNWWNLFKLRAAYGQSGNLTGIGAYDRYNAYSSQTFLSRVSLFSSATLANENIKPERQAELELGADLSFFNNRLGASFNWYNKKVTDLLISRVEAPTTGFSSFLDNVGSLQNRGIELVLNGAPIKNTNFEWNTSVIYNRNRNKALDVGGLRLFSTNPGAPVAIIDGQPIGVFYGTFFARNPDGSLLLNDKGIPLIERGIQNGTEYTPQRDANGLPMGTPLRKVIGDPNPDYTLTFVNDFTYKKLSLHMQFDAVQGVDVWNADWRTRQGVGSGEIAEQEQMGELPRGYIAGVYAVEEWRIDNGNYIKLREISLSYNLGKVKFFKDFTISASGRNLFSIDKYKGYDPEVNAGGQSTILRGIDFGAIPIPRTFTLGVQVKL
ncbi:MAG: SusC/RagA family TonB-linked outer membrane protein [Olivibacter sp.]|nr:SusC/RagA family TonB-linked outer membrane protein [Olivibacter sp. UJ_SKK_5.1]